MAPQGATIPRINDVQGAFIIPPPETGSHMPEGRYFRRVDSTAYAEIQAEGRDVSAAASVFIDQL
jgi:hypothetical protein